jgi:hypothetical protein
VAIRGGTLRKTLTALLAATTLGVAALPSSAEARWGWGGFGVGLATGAIVGGAPRLVRTPRDGYPAYYPYYGYYYGGPRYYGYYPYWRRGWYW